MRFLVFGSAGYVGQRLLSHLRSENLVCFGADLRGAEKGLLVGDIRDFHYVEECFEKARFFRKKFVFWHLLFCEEKKKNRPDVVVHLASFGMSGAEMANKRMTWDVNENGTRNVAICSKDRNCRLIYISTVNVCFNGTEVFGERDDCPYVDPSTQTDAYRFRSFHFFLLYMAFLLVLNLLCGAQSI